MFRNSYAVFLFFIFVAIYYAGSFSKVPFADCIDFVFEAEKLKYVPVATATTHFLYINTVILIEHLIGLDAIEASRFLIILSGAATVSIIYITVKNITKTEWTSLTAAFVFGFSFHSGEMQKL